MFNLLPGENFVPAWSHYFPGLSISPSLPATPVPLLTLAFFPPFVRASNKYPVTVRNCSVHAGLIQPALLQHPRVYGRGKFGLYSVSPSLVALVPPHARRDTRPCDRHAAVGEFIFFFFSTPLFLLVPPLPRRTLSQRNFFHPVGKHSRVGELERTSRSREKSRDSERLSNSWNNLDG